VLAQSGRLTAAVERVERDLLAERMARVEDLEVLVDLISGGLGALRADLRAVRGELAALHAVVGQPLHFTVAREETAEGAGSEAEAPSVRVRASVEDAATAVPPSARLDAS
jgi:hypothetical protein